MWKDKEYQKIQYSFKNIDYSDIRIVQRLLRFYPDLKSRANENMNIDLMLVYLDLNKAIEDIHFTERQAISLKYYIEGWSEREIGNLMGGISQQAVSKLILKISKKISYYLCLRGCDS